MTAHTHAPVPGADAAPARPLPPAPGHLRSALRIFDLSLGEMLWSRRTIFMALLVLAPVLIALVVRLWVSLGGPFFGTTEVRDGVRTSVQMAGPAIFGALIWVLYMLFIVPVLGVFYGTSLIADEVEDKTITYLFVRPLRRGAVLVGKYLAYLACTSFVVLPSVVVVYLLVVPIRGTLGGAFLDLLTDLGLILLSLAVYGAVFAAVGARFKRPLVVGLVFIFGWEPAALAIPGYMRYFTVAYYVHSLVPHALPNTGIVSLLQNVFRDAPGLGASLFWLAVIWAGCLAVGAWTVERREYVLEQ